MTSIIARSFTSTVSSREAYLPIQEESDFGLAQTYLKANKDREADKILLKMLEKYQEAKISRGYFLSRTWHERP